MKKTFNFEIKRRPQTYFKFVLNSSSSSVKSVLFDCEDNYEEDIEIGMWKMTLN